MSLGKVFTFMRHASTIARSAINSIPQTLIVGMHRGDHRAYLGARDSVDFFQKVLGIQSASMDMKYFTPNPTDLELDRYFSNAEQELDNLRRRAGFSSAYEYIEALLAG